MSEDESSFGNGGRFSGDLPGMSAIRDFEESLRRHYGLSGRVKTAREAAQKLQPTEREPILRALSELSALVKDADKKANRKFWIGLVAGAVIGIAGDVICALFL